MRLSLTFVAGALLGVAALLSAQQAVASVCRAPVIRLIPGAGQLCADAPPVAAAAIPTAMPSPTPVPSPTPRIIQVDLEQARMVHQVVYSEMGITVHTAGKEPTVRIPVTNTVLAEKEVLLITSGSCAAGIDYDEKAAIIDASGTRVSVKVPEPKLLGCGVTSTGYFDGQGIFPAPTELYNRLADRSSQEMRTRAEQSDLLAKARDSARSQIELELRRLGFEQVSVQVGALR